MSLNEMAAKPVEVNIVTGKMEQSSRIMDKKQPLAKTLAIIMKPNLLQSEHMYFSGLHWN